MNNIIRLNEKPDSNASVDGEKVEIEKEDRIEQQWPLGAQLLHAKQRPG